MALPPDPHAPGITTTEPFTFILPRQDLSLLPKIEGGKDMGCNGDIRRRHVLDGDRHAAAPSAAST